MKKVSLTEIVCNNKQRRNNTIIYIFQPVKKKQKTQMIINGCYHKTNKQKPTRHYVPLMEVHSTTTLSPKSTLNLIKPSDLNTNTEKTAGSAFK